MTEVVPSIKAMYLQGLRTRFGVSTCMEAKASKEAKQKDSCLSHYLKGKERLTPFDSTTGSQKRSLIGASVPSVWRLGKLSSYHIQDDGVSLYYKVIRLRCKLSEAWSPRHCCFVHLVAATVCH